MRIPNALWHFRLPGPIRRGIDGQEYLFVVIDFILIEVF